jgi:hypothetical protein
VSTNGAAPGSFKRHARPQLPQGVGGDGLVDILGECIQVLAIATPGSVDVALCEVTAKVAPKSPYNLASTTDLCKVGISTLHDSTLPTSPIVLIPSVETGLPENKLWGAPEDGLWLAPLIPVRPDIRAPGHCRLARADLARAPEIVAIGRIFFFFFFFIE